MLIGLGFPKMLDLQNGESNGKQNGKLHENWECMEKKNGKR